MMFSTEISAALLGAIGIITLSLFTTQIVKYFVGIGMFGVFFLLLIAITGNLEVSTFISMSISIFMGCIYDWIVKVDIYSGMLVMTIATIGFVILAILLSTLWHYYRFNIDTYTDIHLLQFHRRFIEDYREILRALQ
jgi:hypothetical protein